MDRSIVDRAPDWLRWTLVLPASVVAYMVVFAAVVIGGKLMNFFSAGLGWGDNFFQYLMGPALAGYGSIMAAMILAPNGRRSVVLGLLAVWMAGYGVLGGAAVFTGDLKSLFAVVVSVIGALAALGADDYRS